MCKPRVLEGSPNQVLICVSSTGPQCGSIAAVLEVDSGSAAGTVGGGNCGGSGAGPGSSQVVSPRTVPSSASWKKKNLPCGGE